MEVFKAPWCMSFKTFESNQHASPFFREGGCFEVGGKQWKIIVINLHCPFETLSVVQ